MAGTLQGGFEVKRGGANELEGDALAVQGFGNGLGHLAEPVEDGEVGKAPGLAAALAHMPGKAADAAHPFFDAVHDKLRLGLGAFRLMPLDERRAGAFGHQLGIAALPVPADKGGRAIDNGRGGAVVADQGQGGDALSFAEPLEQGEVAAAKAVNGLVGVADGEDLRLDAEQQDQLVLGMVEVLEFIDKEMGHPAGALAGKGGVAAQMLHAPGDDQVKVNTLVR